MKHITSSYNFHIVTSPVLSFLSSDYLYELHQMHPIFTLWSASEPELSPVLLSIAAAVEQNTQAQQHVLVTFTPNIAQVSMLLMWHLLQKRREINLHYTYIYMA
jgi:hypothetical protein